MHIVMRLIGFLLAAFVAATALAGCSGDDPAPSSEPASSSSSPEAEESETAVPEEFSGGPYVAVQDWLSALNTGDAAAACDLVTDEFRDLLIEETSGLGYVGENATCKQAMEASARVLATYGGLGNNTLEPVEETETTASVEVYFGGSGVPDLFLLERVDEEWLVSGFEPTPDEPRGRR